HSFNLKRDVMFRNSSILRHLLRRYTGFSLLSLTIYLFIQGTGWSIILGLTLAISGFIALKACPACWLIRFITTITNPSKTCIPYSKKDETRSAHLK
ncbi:MAG: hypothetical protein J6586_01705, partial [Snodgrassella sp.]|nr:hypothetical protein [Snodgrassella sp.]